MQFAGRNGATICYESERVIQSQYICGGIGNGATGYPATEHRVAGNGATGYRFTDY